MQLLKALLAFGIALGMTMCHPVMASSKAQRIGNGEIAMADCIYADHFIETVYHMAKQGRGNYEIMAYLDSVTDPDDRDYVGILMTKINVASITMATRKAYSLKEVVSRHKEICISAIGSDINRY